MWAPSFRWFTQMSGKGYVDGKVAVEGDFTFAIVQEKKE